jgi:hypothetical protein
MPSFCFPLACNLYGIQAFQVPGPGFFIPGVDEGSAQLLLHLTVDCNLYGIQAFAEQ